MIPLAAIKQERVKDMPEVPSIAEKGFKGVAAINPWCGVAGPAKLSRPIVDRLSTYFQKVLSLPEMEKKLDDLGMFKYYAGQDEFAKYLQSQNEMYQDLARRANIKLE